MIAFKDPVAAHRNVGIPVMDGRWTQTTIADEDANGMTFQDCTFEGVRLERVALAGASFVQCRFEDCDFDDCDLLDAQIISCEGTEVRLSSGTLTGLLFADCRFQKLDIGQSAERMVLAESTLERLSFSGPGAAQRNMTMSGCTLGEVMAENTVWSGGSFVQMDLSNWRLDNAAFERCSLVRCEAPAFDFGSIRFDQCNLYQGGYAGAVFAHAEGTIFAECDLTEANLAGATLSGCLFAKAKAVSADFAGAVLDGAMFPKATLTGASFAGASAPGSVWTDADATGANLERLYAHRAVFRNATLTDASVQGADLTETELHGVEAPLDGADTRDSRGTVDWRAERERQARER